MSTFHGLVEEVLTHIQNMVRWPFETDLTSHPPTTPHIPSSYHPPRLSSMKLGPVATSHTPSEFNQFQSLPHLHVLSRVLFYGRAHGPCSIGALALHARQINHLKPNSLLSLSRTRAPGRRCPSLQPKAPVARARFIFLWRGFKH